MLWSRKSKRFRKRILPCLLDHRRSHAYEQRLHSLDLARILTLILLIDVKTCLNIASLPLILFAFRS